MIPSAQSEIHTSSPAAAQLDALLHHAGIAPLDDTGWVRITGSDRVRWLNGMVTNSIQELKPGAGNYNFLLSAQGRIQGDAWIFAEPDVLLLETASSQVAGLMTLLDRFIIMDDVELADITGSITGLSISGPNAASLLAKIGLPIESVPPLTRQTLSWNSSEVTVIYTYSPLAPRYEIWTATETAAALRQVLETEGAVLCGTESLEWLRILEGTPLYGTDIRDRELPQETGQSRALHFAKGCYLGQEIVERIRSRGNVHRTFSVFRLEGTLPAPGTKLEANGKETGELTTVASIPFPSGTVQLALGYARREALDLKTPLVYPGGTANPVTVPFTGR